MSEYAWTCSFRRIATRAPSGGNIRVGPGVEFDTVEGDAAAADGHLGQRGPDLGIEAIAIDAQVSRRGVVADQTGEHALEFATCAVFIGVAGPRRVTVGNQDS